MSERLPQEEAEARYVVLDDDPTGVQTLAGIRVLLGWKPGDVAAALARAPVGAPDHERARDGTGRCAGGHRVRGPRRRWRDAPDAVSSCAVTARCGVTCSRSIEAVAAVVAAGRIAPLLLVPALPSAGRVTVGGVHMIERDGRRVPLHETEYARDGPFAYRSSRLLEWAEERSAGLLRVGDGHELGARRAAGTGTGGRRRGPRAAGRGRAARGARARRRERERPGARRRGLSAGARVGNAGARALRTRVRRSPRSHDRARRSCPRPARATASSSSAARTSQRRPRSSTHSSPNTPTPPSRSIPWRSPRRRPEPEIERAARAASERLRAGGLAVVSTPRVRPRGTETLAAGERIARGRGRALPGRPSPGRVLWSPRAGSPRS